MQLQDVRLTDDEIALEIGRERLGRRRAEKALTAIQTQIEGAIKANEEAEAKKAGEAQEPAEKQAGATAGG